MTSYKLGITGSIAMGKTQTAKFFEEKGIPVWDADKTVHKLYKKGQKGYLAIKKISESFVNDVEVDRKKILASLKNNKNILEKVEKQIHPLVKLERNGFIKKMKNYPLLVFDIPLLFETKSEDWLDGVLVVKTSDEEQERRVLKRGNVSKEQFFQIKSKQIPINIKCKLATFVINTELGVIHAKKEVSKIIEIIKGSTND